MTSLLAPLMSSVLPTTPGSAPKRERQSPSLRMTTDAPPGAPSSSAKVRPAAASARRTWKKLGVTCSARTRSASPFTTRFTAVGDSSAISCREDACSLYSWYSPGDMGSLSAPSRPRWRMAIRRSGCAKGSGESSTLSTSVNTAVLAPTPRASVSTATAVKAGCRVRLLNAKRMSVPSPVISAASLVSPMGSVRFPRMPGSSRSASPKSPSQWERALECQRIGKGCIPAQPASRRRAEIGARTPPRSGPHDRATSSSCASRTRRGARWPRGSLAASRRPACACRPRARCPRPCARRPSRCSARSASTSPLSDPRASTRSTRPVDAVVTLCAEEACPVWLGDALRVHWGLPDPAAADGSAQDRLQAFRATRDELARRLAAVFRDPSDG